ncbi:MULTISPECIES: hypothetical protein [unclassified Algoriphagus]|jgi:tetratricopeptide (TPR) repeat protein|uniref:hypothetical protein n=1 Tax=unclassified Algoriphagus TaxID=2641541 RepID=UPI000C599FE0|nr:MULTISPECIES: hypothetical protein [unclassified Algoriphagus]MAL14127.1 hypothetical protein [Algoriphagus sp.]MAN87708.1 hypothetical protein [Algoriphagus sp.]QYH37890.1 hypothetical protein GYM62_03425 [Algoriphagus sp. NBT04N3]
MLTILTTTDIYQKVQMAIASVDRLDELVSITEHADTIKDHKSLVIDSDEITIPLDWYDLEPPYVFPKTSLSQENLLALVFYKLGNHQKAFEFISEENPLYHHLLIATHLHFGYEISADMVDFCSNTSLHNTAILGYYGVVEKPRDFNELQNGFAKALSNAENDEIKVFTAKHYLNLLLDAGDLDKAKQLAEEQLEIAISDDAKNAMSTLLAGILMAQLQVPYVRQELDKIHNLQLQSIAQFEAKGLKIQAGMLLVDAAEIANFKEDFIASKELINRAIQYFKEEDIPEFLGEAGFKKAILLYTWSKNGSPQYYKAAINAFQDVLKVFKRDTHPQKFADVHHNLALIYSEIPVAADEKPMWTAFCASSFKEVLAFYTKDKYPYENAMASHNYATALMHFPPAKIHDNLDKASGLFEEALEVRTAEAYPFERALTLLNQLELGWLTHNETNEEELKKYEEMKEKAEEVKTLVTDSGILEQAEKHLQELEKVKSLI